MKQYVYHMVPVEMKGDKLIPLNSLRYPYPQLYEKYTKKYFDHPERPKLLSKQVPKLNCLWNDVLHFLPLHPYYVYQAITSLGIKAREKQPFFKIPIENLINNKMLSTSTPKRITKAQRNQSKKMKLYYWILKVIKNLKNCLQLHLNITKKKVGKGIDLDCFLISHIY